MLPNAWALTSLLVLTLFSFGVFLNDEGGQLQVIYEILHGDDEQPLQFYAIGEGQLLPVWEENTQSPFVTMVGVGLYYPIKALDAVIPVLYLLVMAWGASLYATVKSVSGPWYQGEPPKSNWKDELRWKASHTTFGHRVLLAVSVIAVLLLFIGIPSMDYNVWGELVAVQLGHAALFVLAAVWFRDLVAEHFAWDKDGERQRHEVAGWFAWAWFMVSPLLFWGVGAKYHAMSIFLIVAAMKLWERKDGWRYAALGVAALGVMNTPFGLPLLFAMLILVVPVLWAQRKNPQIRRAVLIGGVSLVAALAAFAAYNLQVWGRIAGRRGPSGEQFSSPSAFIDWAFTTLRFESWGQSFTNLWQLFIDSRAFESSPASLLSLTPIMIFAFAAPYVLWKQRSKDSQAWLALLSIILFLMAFVHAVNRPGAGADNRFAIVVIPAFIWLAVHVMQDWLREAPTKTWSAMAVGTLVTFLGSLILLMVLADKKHAVYDPQPALQVRQYAFWLGTIAWPALVVAAALPWSRWPVDKWRIQGALLGASFAAPLLWLFHTMVLFRRSLPSWPFGSGNDNVEFVLPHWTGVREWMIQNLLPL